MWLTVLLLCIQCSSGCSSWLDHILLLCSLKVEFHCLLSPLLTAFPDIICKAIKVREPFLQFSVLGDLWIVLVSVSAGSRSLFLPRSPTCMLNPFVLPGMQGWFILHLIHCAPLFTMSVLASTDYSFFLFASLFASFLGSFSCSLSCIFFCAIKTKKLVLKALSDQ